MVDHQDMEDLAPLAMPAREGIVDQIVDILIDAVLDGRYRPGTALPPERELADSLGVNRASLRQATARLAQIGLLEARQGSGTLVRDPASTSDAALLARLLIRSGPGLLHELLDVREVLGGLAGRLAARNATAAQVESLREAAERIESAPDAAARQEAELAYFAHLIDTTDNRVLRLLFSWVEQVHRPAASTFQAAFADADDVISAITSITDAVAATDEAGAEQAVLAYARDSAARMLLAHHTPTH